MTPLLIAAEKGHAAVVDRLIVAKCNFLQTKTNVSAADPCLIQAGHQLQLGLRGAAWQLDRVTRMICVCTFFFSGVSMYGCRRDVRSLWRGE